MDKGARAIVLLHDDGRLQLLGKWFQPDQHDDYVAAQDELDSWWLHYIADQQPDLRNFINQWLGLAKLVLAKSQAMVNVIFRPIDVCALYISMSVVLNSTQKAGFVKVTKQTALADLPCYQQTYPWPACHASMYSALL